MLPSAAAAAAVFVPDGPTNDFLSVSVLFDLLAAHEDAKSYANCSDLAKAEVRARFEGERGSSSTTPATTASTDTHHLIYGEIDVTSMTSIFNTILRDHKTIGLHRTEVLRLFSGTFIDLGSGSGKSTIAGCILGRFQSSVGIELIECLYDVSLNNCALVESILLDQRRKLLSSTPFDSDFGSCYAENCDSNVDDIDIVETDIANQSCREMSKKIRNLKFCPGSFLDKTCADLSLGDVFFINSTCFPAALMADIASHCQFKSGSLFIVLSRTLPDSDINKFKLLHESRLSMSWGHADVFIQKVL